MRQRSPAVLCDGYRGVYLNWGCGGLISFIAKAGTRCSMKVLLWVLQGLAALLYAASGVMKTFMLDKVSQGVASFGALPREGWIALGVLELVCTAGLIVPGLSIGSRS